MVWISAGVGIASLGEISFNPRGFVLILLTVLFDSLRSAHAHAHASAHIHRRTHTRGCIGAHTSVRFAWARVVRIRTQLNPRMACTRVRLLEGSRRSIRCSFLAPSLLHVPLPPGSAQRVPTGANVGATADGWLP